VGVGAFLGANARYWVGGWAADRWGTAFPYGTFIINMSGSFAIGLSSVIGGKASPLVQVSRAQVS